MDSTDLSPYDVSSFRERSGRPASTAHTPKTRRASRVRVQCGTARARTERGGSRKAPPAAVSPWCNTSRTVDNQLLRRASHPSALVARRSRQLCQPRSWRAPPKNGRDPYDRDDQRRAHHEPPERLSNIPAVSGGSSPPASCSIVRTGSGRGPLMQTLLAYAAVKQWFSPGKSR